MIKTTRSVEEIGMLIQEYQLMSSKDYAAMRARWFRPGRKEVGDAGQFLRWLVVNKFITEFVARMISGGKSAQLVLNHYRLLDRLDSGPMAGAYLAADPLDQHVAIDILPAPSAADKTQMAKFQHAAQKAMQVHHVNVARVLESGEAHGLHFLVWEFHEGQTLRQILDRRHTLPYAQAARLMALALAGVEALHGHGVPAGDLTADCLLLTHAGKDAPHQRTVKILRAGFHRTPGDESALIQKPEEPELTPTTTIQPAVADDVPGDIFHLGCLFYRAIAGRMPYEAEGQLEPLRPAQPICQANPEVPEMLGQLIDEMINPSPQKRPRKAGHVAKALRVFLAAEEHPRETGAEEHLALVQASAPIKARVEPAPDGDADEDDAEQETRPRPHRRHAEGVRGKLGALWDEVRPEARDLVFLSGGAVSVLLVILLIELLVGLRFIYVAGLVTGAAASYFVEVFVRWRRNKEPAD